MNGSSFFIGIVLLWLSVTASATTPDSLAKIKFEQRISAPISLSLEFRDETGKPIRLAESFDRGPAILVLGYYGCPMLCTLVLNGLVETFQDLKQTAGVDFSVISVSIDPSETPALAFAKKQIYLKRYGRPSAARGWHFLTGDERQIGQLAAEIGFSYAYDKTSKQYAHPSGFVVLTPQGKVARYFFGVTYSPEELQAALRDAAAEKPGSPIQQLFMLCFHYNPITGKYGPLIMTIVRVSGVLTILGLICLAFALGPSPLPSPDNLRERENRNAAQGGEVDPRLGAPKEHPS